MEKQEKPSWIRFSVEVNLPVLATMAFTCFLAYQAHQQSMENASKVNQLLVKYEQTLDTFIQNDPAALKTYQGNLKDALASLSPEEHKLLNALLAVSSPSQKQIQGK